MCTQGSGKYNRLFVLYCASVRACEALLNIGDKLGFYFSIISGCWRTALYFATCTIPYWLLIKAERKKLERYFVVCERLYFLGVVAILLLER